MIGIKTHRVKNRKELTPNITFQPNKIFVRNDLFERIIKSCKIANLEFLKLKEKLGLWLYEVIDEQEFERERQKKKLLHRIMLRMNN